MKKAFQFHAIFLFTCLFRGLVVAWGPLRPSNLETTPSFRGGASNSTLFRKRQAVRRRDENEIVDETSMISNLSTMAGRKACGFYVWDAPSALLYKWCNHLLRDSVYEGRGGRKFVRIEPGSMLQLLYPASHRYSPDRCIFCGGSFEDHVALKWSKHLYNPFDLLLDKTLRAGRTVKREEFPARVVKHRGKSITLPPRPSEEKFDFLFHRRYITDLDQLRDVSNKIKSRKWGRKKRAQKYLSEVASAMEGSQGVDTRMVNYGNGRQMWYIVPSATNSSKIVQAARWVVLNAVDSLIRLERYEKVQSEAASKKVPILR